MKSFTLYVNDREVYAEEIADALAADLQPLATSGVIRKIYKYDTNPANNPQPPERPPERRYSQVRARPRWPRSAFVHMSAVRGIPEVVVTRWDRRF